jgi:polyhydroxyalkanoate synthesis regulator phasin
MFDDAGSGGTEARSSGQSIRDLIERTFLVGVGAAAFTKDRIQELVEEFVRRGELSGDEGREMVDRLVMRSREEARSAARRADSSLQGALRDFGVATRREVEDLELRVRQLEHRISLLEAPQAAGPSGPVADDAGAAD